jgi:tetratricopeptide (TPR) repeat protein
MAEGAKRRRDEACPCGSGRVFNLCHGAPEGGTAADEGAELLVPSGEASADPAESLRRAKSLFDLADGFSQAGCYQDAIAALSQAVELFPDRKPIVHNLAVACRRAGRVKDAATWMKRLCALQPTVARTHHELGVVLALAGDDDAALEAHRRAIELDPAMTEAHDRAAGILLRQGKRDEAVLVLQQGIAAAPDTLLGRLFGIDALIFQNRTSEAEAAARQLIASEPSSADVHLALGRVLIDSGRFDEAATHIERAIALAPSHELAPWKASAYHRLVTAKRMTEADRPLIARILFLLETPNDAVPAHAWTSLHAAAGKAFDDLGDYADAIRHFDAAREICGRTSHFDRAQYSRGVDRKIAQYTPEYFARNAALGSDDETPVLVLGMPRSGTTLVERIVSSHPSIGGGGELTFWYQRAGALTDVAATTRAETAAGICGDYLRLLRKIAPNALRVTDKLPFNFSRIGLIHLLFPKARIIHCRRNPIDTCLSIYTTFFLDVWPFANNRGDLAFYYREYLRLMQHWRTVLSPGCLLEVDYEDVTATPEATARRLVAFCGLEWDPACLHPERNPDAVQTASVWQARQPIYRRSVERWRNYEPWLGELRELLPQST